MNAAQNKGYWRRFSAALRAQSADRQCPFTSAEKESLRKQWHAAAGIDPLKSHADFNHSETTRIFNHFDALANPDSFDAALLDADQDAAERATLLAGIAQYPMHYTSAIVGGITGGRHDDADKLSLADLRKLRMTLTMRERSGRVAKKNSCRATGPVADSQEAA
jgi:hypothetical protein